GVFVAAGDLNGDNKADIITGVGVGGGPHVRAFSGADGSLLANFMAYDPAFRGGVFVASGDVNGDGKADIITGLGLGGSPEVKAFSGVNGAQLADFAAFPKPGPLGTPWTSGVRVAATDFNGDGVADIITSAGRGRGPQVRVFSGNTFTQLTQFDAADPSFLGGIFVGGI